MCTWLCMHAKRWYTLAYTNACRYIHEERVCKRMHTYQTYVYSSILGIVWNVCIQIKRMYTYKHMYTYQTYVYISNVCIHWTRVHVCTYTRLCIEHQDMCMYVYLHILRHMTESVTSALVRLTSLATLNVATTFIAGHLCVYTVIVELGHVPQAPSSVSLTAPPSMSEACI